MPKKTKRPSFLQIAQRNRWSQLGRLRSAMMVLNELDVHYASGTHSLYLFTLEQTLKDAIDRRYKLLKEV